MQIDFGFNGNEKLVLAVSGGVDSMCLLDLILNQSGLPKENIIVAHFDHGIREDSSLDADLVEKVARQNDLKFELAQADLSQVKSSLEEKARRHRYDFLEIIRDLHKADWILTAHHADDQAETIMMKFLKGTFIRGLRGILKKDEARKLYRPLLGVRKNDLYKYAQENGLEYREDSTNTDTKYERNQMRQEIIPLLEKAYLGLTKRLGKSAEFYVGLERFLDKALQDWMNNNLLQREFGREFKILDYSKEEDFMRFMLINEILWEDLSQADFTEIDKLILESQTGSFRKVGCHYIYLGFEEVYVSELSPEDLEEKVYLNRIAELDLLDLEERGLKVRRYEDGDVYCFEEGKKPSKLKKYFVENKVPWYLRRGYPLLVDEEGVVVGINC